MERVKFAAKSFFGDLMGLIVFLIVLVVLNLLNSYISNDVLNGIISFLNVNLLLIVLLSILFMFGGIFDALGFPLNLPAPIFRAFGGFFLVLFLFKIFDFINQYLRIPENSVLNQIYPLIPIIVFIAVLVIGYVIILTSSGRIKSKKTHKK